MIPNMLQKGHLELALSKPINRSGLLLYKFLGGLTSITLLSTFLIGGVWFAISVVSGFWNFWFLITIPVLIFFFSVIFSVSVLFGLITRSPIISITVSIVLWFTSYSCGNVNNMLQLELIKNISPTVKTLVNITHHILPKTHEISKLNGYIMYQIAKDKRILELAEAQQTMNTDSNPFKNVDPYYTILTSFGFMAVMLGLSCLIFSKKEY